MYSTNIVPIVDIAAIFFFFKFEALILLLRTEEFKEVNFIEN